MVLSTQHIFFSSQLYHRPTLGKSVPLFNSSSRAIVKPMLLIILYATSVFVSYQRISKAKILRIPFQVFSGIFLLVNTNLLLVHHTTIMLYTLVRTFGIWFHQLCALGGYVNPQFVANSFLKRGVPNLEFPPYWNGNNMGITVLDLRPQFGIVPNQVMTQIGMKTILEWVHDWTVPISKRWCINHHFDMEISISIWGFMR